MIRINVNVVLSVILFLVFVRPAMGLPLYQFDSPQQQERFQTILDQTRCLVCQNQNLSESNAPLAQDLCRTIYEQVKRGRSEEHIKKFLVNRYGNFILLKPPLNRSTWLLWLGPIFLFLFAMIYCKKASR
jgi:cytochrome c-type biogenesis protein CcmH